MLAEVLTAAASWNGVHPLLTYQVPPSIEGELRVGQLVAVPYGERLVEGIVWELHSDIPAADLLSLEAGEVLRPITTILDLQPALLPHQMSLAQWISEYYVTPLSQVALMMLPPGLIQRSHMVLHLAETDEQKRESVMQESSPQLRALIGLLLTEGELNVKRLHELLGPKRAKEILKEARHSSLISSDAELAAPRAKARVKRIVRLAMQGPKLEQWRAKVEAVLQRALQEAQPVAIAADNVRRRPELHSEKGRKGRKSVAPNPWELPIGVTATLELSVEDKESLRAQHQLAALELLQQDMNTNAQWTPNALCKASGMTTAQLQQLVREGVVGIEQSEVRRDPLQGRALPASLPLRLTTNQQHALDCIVGAEYQPRPILLHGVTGSGKTEVYLQAISAVIARGQRSIMLVPEIALTTQAVQRVAARFPGRVAIIHSELSTGERYDEWRRIRAGQVDVVIGSRSALFAPVANLGLILVDEEHEPAYKQSERRPTYHAREAAIMLARILRIPIVLGSATPSVETYYRAQRDYYQLVELPSRIGATLPPIEIIDLRDELHSGNTSIISRRLHQELEHVLENGQQAILFLNRRGAASCVLCRDCGYVALCDRCDIPLTYHSTERILLCHYCGKQSKVLHFCPNCKSSGIRYFGLGTEKVQETIQRAFPQARLLRWDRDTARNRRAHEHLLDSFANRQADVLIGTQMIAKGLDLPGVTLVGVVSADIALSLPDYSASERAFTLLTQVAGRAGRGVEPGRVVIQTFNPQHFCIDAASRHDYAQFYATEIEVRQRYAYPPFRCFVKFTYSHENRHRSQNEALLLYEKLCQWIARLELPDTDIVGPAPALMERLRGKYHWQMIVRGPDLHRLLRVIDAPGWEIDIDPVSTL